MKRILLPNTDLAVSPIAYGCMTLGGTWDTSPLSPRHRVAAREAVETALAEGINLFDHADIYCCGKSEQVFGELVHDAPQLREQIVLLSKCGIIPGSPGKPLHPSRYDFSFSHLTSSVEGILRRLKTDHLDILLLHRPDPLAEPEEVARAFDILHSSGKVRYFGVSNHTPGQIELLRKAVGQPIILNQVEFSLTQPLLVLDGILANQARAVSGFSDGMLDYCRNQGIALQAWRPLGRGLLLEEDSVDTRLLGARQLVFELAERHQVGPEAVLLAWVMRHPAGMQPVIGTTRPERIRSCCQAVSMALTREEWYALLEAARGDEVP